MSTEQVTTSRKKEYVPPAVDADYYRILDLLDDKERAAVKRVRDFCDAVVAPVIEDYWARDKFPHELIPKIAELGIGGVGYQGYGAAGRRWLLDPLNSLWRAR